MTTATEKKYGRVGTRLEMRVALRLATKMGCGFDQALGLVRRGIMEPPARYARGGGESLTDLAAAGQRVRAERGTRKTPSMLGENLKKTWSTGTMLGAVGGGFSLKDADKKTLLQLTRANPISAWAMTMARRVIERVRKRMTKENIGPLESLAVEVQDAKLAEGLLIASKKLGDALRLDPDEALAQMIAVGL
jgi:hypothetical protein